MDMMEEIIGSRPEAQSKNLTGEAEISI